MKYEHRLLTKSELRSHGLISSMLHEFQFCLCGYFSLLCLSFLFTMSIAKYLSSIRTVGNIAMEYLAFHICRYPAIF